MNAPSEPEQPDPLTSYIAGDPDAVRAAAPREPTSAEWEAARRQIHARLAQSRALARRPWRVWVACGAALTGAVAAAVTWVAFSTNLLRDNPRAPEMAEARRKPVEVAPAPREA